MKKREKKSFWALLVVQFFGAFNDNLLKVLVQLSIVAWVFDAGMREQLVILVTVVFVAPFLIFSMLAGRVSDRYGKPAVIRGVQVWQLVVVFVAVASVLAKSIPIMMASIFLLSMQATFFSPAKYGVMPELMGEGELSDGNGLLNSGTFLAILIGTVAGTFLVGYRFVACGFLILGALGGLIGSFFMEKLPAAKPDESWAWNPLADLIANWKIIRQDRTLARSIMAINYFWFMGSILVTIYALYAKDMMRANEEVAGFLLISVTIGIALGSFLAGRWSRGKVELGLVPLGALGMSFFGLDLYRAWHSLPHALVDFFMLGFCGGLYEIPLNALIQWRSPAGERGRVLATQNFLSFVAILIGAIFLWVLGTPLGLNPAQIFLALGITSLMGTAIVYSVQPAAGVRFLLYVLTSYFYRMDIVNGDRVPARGPALLVAKHHPPDDCFLIGISVPRLVRFLASDSDYQAHPWRCLLRAMKAVPSQAEARKALQEGEVVCVFVENGDCSGQWKGIISGLDVPVIPVMLNEKSSSKHVAVVFGDPPK
ncbi:MAG: MFS transporter [Elusimicrobiota bacterium]|jgi:acyl-[acyl-carrier-protein]-phospholipid O-acyltransferase/long-chain-fatty-acid--[acyl-carrier-protein] ligase